MEKQYEIRPVMKADPLFAGCAEVFAEYAEKRLGTAWRLGTAQEGTEAGLTLARDDALPEEGYRLAVGESGAQIAASAEKGMHNGLADLLPRLSREGDSILAPALSLTEAPDCPWRGLMVDLARQWHPLSYILGYIDLCWQNRASRLQLHFTDFQSFTLPLSSYPALATEGRSYTRDEIAEMAEYARKRGITLVPEVDIPGHTSQFFLKYPELFGTGDVLPACPEVFDALCAIFTEVAEMFPYSPWIHIGGDEANIASWERCPRTEAYMKEHGIAAFTKCMPNTSAS